MKTAINVSQLTVMLLGWAFYSNQEYGAAIFSFSFALSLAVAGFIQTFFYRPKVETKKPDYDIE